MKKFRLFSIEGPLARPAYAAGELGLQILEGRIENVAPPDDHIVSAGCHVISRTDTNRLPQPAADAVSDDGVARLPGNGDSETRCIFRSPVEHFEQEQPAPALLAPAHRQEFRPLAQPADGLAGGPLRQRVLARAPPRRTAACGRARGARRPRAGRPWWPCGHGNHAAFCGRASRVDRYASFV